MLPPYAPTSRPQHALRVLLGLFMVGAALAHFFFARETFAAQVPDWVPLDTDLVILLSGVVELVLGLAMLFGRRYRVWVGLALAVFYVLIFPGNLSQYLNRVDAFGLDTDAKRLARLFFQPLLILAALWSTGFFAAWRERGNRGGS
ncbi:MAG: DoxX family membrane protein [Opitutales bacterium]